MISQKIEWLKWPPPLFRTTVRMSSGTASRSLSSCSIVLSPSSGCLSIAPFRLVTYVAWCRSWWISIVRASMWGSSASKAYGSGGSSKAIAQSSLQDQTYSGGVRAGRTLPPSLVLDRLDRDRRRGRIEVLAALAHGPQVPVQLVQQRDAGRDVEAHDRLVRDAVQVLDERAQRVPVRRDDDQPAVAQVGHDRVVPVRQHPGHHVLQALAARPQLGRDRRVARVARLAVMRLECLKD